MYASEKGKLSNPSEIKAVRFVKFYLYCRGVISMLMEDHVNYILVPDEAEICTF